jgi:hypothetical protein
MCDAAVERQVEALNFAVFEIGTVCWGAPRDQSSESFSVKQLHAMILDQALRAVDPSKLLRWKEFPTCTTVHSVKQKQWQLQSIAPSTLLFALNAKAS